MIVRTLENYLEDILLSAPTSDYILPTSTLSWHLIARHVNSAADITLTACQREQKS